MKKFLSKVQGSRIIRYIFFGGCTTLVNLFFFYLFRRILKLEINLSNILSIIIALFYAYYVNSMYVFKSRHSNKVKGLLEFIRFIGSRLITMIIEIVGVYCLTNFLFINDIISKFIMQVIVILLNYILSKIIVFNVDDNFVKQ